MSAASSILAVHTPPAHQIYSSRLVCNNSTTTTTNRRRLQLRLHGHYKTRRRRQGQQAARAMAGKKEEEEEEAVVYRGDKLILRGLRFHGTHGVKPEEKKLGQKFVIDVDAWMDLAAAGDSDNISDTVSYTEIYRIAKTVVEGPSHNLLESVAQSIANSTLLKFPQISAVRVKVEKPHVAVQGVLDCLGVQIFRERKA